MPSSLAHYAIAAASLTPLDLPHRKLGLYSLWAVAPDLDVVPAIAWTLSAPHLPLGADALLAGGNLLGHRGFSHTIPAALLVGVLVWDLTRDRRHALAASTAWGTHVLLDTMTDWSTIPFWPFSEAVYMVPLVTGVDPLLTLFSIATIAALLGPPVADKLGWPGEAKRAQIDGWGQRWGRPMAYASVAALVFSAAMVGWAGLASGDAMALPAHAPRTATLDAEPDAEVDAWNVTTRRVPFAQGDTRQVPFAANASQAPEDVLPAARCAFDDLGPFAPVGHPVWELRQEDDRWIATAQDLVRNATGTGGPVMHLAVANGTVEDAWISGGGDEEPRFRSLIPGPVLEGSSCR